MNDSGAATTLFSLFTNAACPNADYKPQALGEITTSATADGTNAKYQVVANNIDSTALDAYVFIAWTEQ